MMSSSTTNTVSQKSPELTIEDLKKISFKHVFGSTGTGKKKSWFEKTMNKLGWYRQSEWFFVDMRKVSGWPGYMPSIPKFEDEYNETGRQTEVKKKKIIR